MEGDGSLGFHAESMDPAMGWVPACEARGRLFGSVRDLPSRIEVQPRGTSPSESIHSRGRNPPGLGDPLEKVGERFEFWIGGGSLGHPASGFVA